MGLFPENLPAPHLVFALISFLVGSLVALLVGIPLQPPVQYVSILLGIVGLTALVLSLANQDLGIGFGGMERMVAYPVLFWELGFGGYLMSAPGTSPAIPPAQKTA